jgi:alpha-acetolactate decarboxylase
MLDMHKVMPFKHEDKRISNVINRDYYTVMNPLFSKHNLSCHQVYGTVMSWFRYGLDSENRKCALKIEGLFNYLSIQKIDKQTLEMVRAGLHCSFNISRQMLPLLLMFG